MKHPDGGKIVFPYHDKVDRYTLKGALKVYNYYCLKYREGKKVISKHIPSNELEGIVKQLKLRKKYEKEIGYYMKRIIYLNKILGSGKKAEGGLMEIKAKNNDIFPAEVHAASISLLSEI